MNSLHHVISVSGGKDSTALLLLAIEQHPENLSAVFADTGNEHQITYDYLDYLSERTNIPIQRVKADFTDELKRKAIYVHTKWREEGIDDTICDRAIELLKPTGNSFLDMCMWKGRFPSTKARFCSTELKRNPIIEQVHLPLLDQRISVESWQGIRAEESPARAALPVRDLVGVFNDEATLHNYRPLLNWSTSDVFEMHRKHGIEPNKLYQMGMGRVGCMPCIHARKDELLEIHKRFPKEVERIKEWEALVSQASKRGSSTFFTSASNRGDGILEMIQWSKTSYGGTQYDILRAFQDEPRCSSLYGLCE